MDSGSALTAVCPSPAPGLPLPHHSHISRFCPTREGGGGGGGGGYGGGGGGYGGGNRGACYR
jgi:hypothetical protein